MLLVAIHCGSHIYYDGISNEYIVYTFGDDSPDLIIWCRNIIDAYLQCSIAEYPDPQFPINHDYPFHNAH